MDLLDIGIRRGFGSFERVFHFFFDFALFCIEFGSRGDVVIQYFCAKLLDGVFGHPGFDFFFCAIAFSGIAYVVPAIAVRVAFDECGAVALSGAFDGLGSGFVHGNGVAAIYGCAGNAEGKRSIGDAFARGDISGGGVFAVVVVFTDVDDREFPYCGEVHDFEEDALIGGAVAKEADGNLVGAAFLG